MLPISRHFTAVRRAWESGDARIELLQNARIGMDKMERQLRQLTDIISVTAASDNNGRIVFRDAEGEIVTFQRIQSGGYYWLGYGPFASPEILCGPIDSLKFICYGKDGVTQTVKPRAIRSIEIKMTVGSGDEDISPQTFTSRVFLGKDLVTLSINEIMYNPSSAQESDKYNEWIELYNYGADNIDVAGWIFDGDALEADDIYGTGTTLIPPGGYAIITDKDTAIYNEVIENGGFESAKLAMWQRSEGWKRKKGGHRGKWRLQRSADGWISQQVSIPLYARSVFFFCWEKTTSNPQATKLIVTLRNTAGLILQTLYEGYMSSVWSQHTADLSDYAGSSVIIYLETGAGGKYWIDDISVIWSYVDKDAIRLRVDDNKIGNGLSNGGEYINLVIPGADGQTVDELTYDDSWGADGNGYTLERIDQEELSDSEDNWSESAQPMGTPGFKNSITP